MAGIEAALSGHETVGLDTSLFIYHIEGAAPYAEVAGLVFDYLAAGRFRGVTSVLTLMELAVKPLQLGRIEVADEYEVLLASFPHLTIFDLDKTIAHKAAELRAYHRLRPADALQVAACLSAGATAFLTNDRDLRRVPDLQILLLKDFLTS